MQLTMEGEYAVRAMMHIASLPKGTVARIPDISREWDVPEKFLRKIVAKLTKGGLLLSHRGAGGGVSLGKAARKISLLDVIELVEGPMALNKCLIDHRFCRRTRSCTVHAVWCEAQTAMRSVLGSRTLAELTAPQSANS
jgi:Rrf2 family transcriptional regulator, iron-sulfur cluster assembly transcription factor